MSESETARSTPQEFDIHITIPDDVKVDYVRDRAYQVVRPTGAMGGLNAVGSIQATFYNETAPIPDRQIIKLSPDGSQIGQIDVHFNDDPPQVLRNCLVTLVFDLEVARSVHSWLGEQIARGSFVQSKAEEIKARKPE